MRFRLRTLLIVVGVAPAVLAVLWWMHSAGITDDLTGTAIGWMEGGLFVFVPVLAAAYAVAWGAYVVRYLLRRLQNRK